MGCGSSKVDPAGQDITSKPGAQKVGALAADREFWSPANAAALLAATASASGPKAKKLGGVDPRWDVDGFGAWLAGCPCVRVGFLRATKPLGRDQVTEHEWVTELPHGAGVDGVQLYSVLSAAFGTQRSSEMAIFELTKLLQVLEGADEDDLVWWDCLALSTDDGNAGRAEAFRAFTTYKAQSVVLPRIAGPDDTSVFACMEPMALLALSCFCQRIYNAADEEVKAGLDLSKFFDLPGLLMSLQRESDGQLAFVAEMLEEVIRALTPVAADETGFRVLCKETQVAFIRTPAIKRWAKAGGPCRRRQEISESDLIIGRLPRGRILSLSHCWDATCNCDPTGEKMRDLAKELVALDAHEDEENGIFIDYCSLPQMAPRNAPLHLIGGAPLPERTAKETKRFSFALSEMSRMYAYGRCEVVVLKDSRPPDAFPDGSGEVLFREGATVELEGNTVWLLDAAGSRTTVKWVGGAKNGSGQKVVLGKVEGKVGEKLVAVEGAELGDASLTDFFLNCCGWGLARADKYEDRGWCVCEYTISKFNGLIANPNHIGVREVDDIRQWPTTVEAYEEMMDKKAARPVGFTFDSDRETVRFIFYRICFGMLHCFLPDEWAKAGPGGALPSIEQLKAAEQLEVGNGDPAREYYLHVSAVYPAVAAGSVQGAHAELLHGLTSTALACTDTWLVRRLHPSNAVPPSP